MKIIALHNLEEVASLLTDVTLITEMDVSSVPNLEKFKQYLKKYKFNATIVLGDLFNIAVEEILTNPKAPKAVVILVKEEKEINRFLRLGITELNVESIPFNPLTLFVKIKGLLSNIGFIRRAIEEGEIKIDFYRYGLFNLLNLLTQTDKSGFLAVKDMEEDKILYSLRIRNGQVVSASVEVEKIAEIHLDDSIPKIVVEEPVTHEDRVLFKNTAEFYKSLLEMEETPQMETPVAVKPKIEPQKASFVKVNPLRERRIYTFPYRGYKFYTQPFEGIERNERALVAVTQIDDHTLSALRVLKIKGGNFKILTSPSITGFLKLQGFENARFLRAEDVEVYEFPFLGSKLECVLFLDGILVSGNLFGSYVSREIEYFDRVFGGHLRVFHHANIASEEKLSKAMETLAPVLDKTFYIFPNYGYAIDRTSVGFVKEVLSNLSFPEGNNSLSQNWKNLVHILPRPVENFDEFINLLRAGDTAVLFNLVDEMETLGITPYEL